MKILFIRAYDFPLGGAPQNRLLGICRGLIDQGHHVEVHQYAPSKLDLQQNHLPEQVYKSVKIYNHAWRWSPARNKYSQIIGLVFGYISTLFNIVKSYREFKVDYVFINVEKNLYLFPLYFVSRIIGAKLGRDLNEYPSLMVKQPTRKSLLNSWKLETNYKWFDVLFFMTFTLQDFYIKHARNSVKSLILPMTVDIERFPRQKVDFCDSTLITYCGDLSQDKDGTITLLEAFTLIKNDFPELKLRLIGWNNNSRCIEKLHEKIEQLELKDRTILTGFVNPEEIPDMLYESRLLVLSRPDNLQSRGGFPTKMGEYLSTGIPVVATKIGELPIYLQDKVNVFMAEADNPQSFANAMRFSLLNRELSIKVGRNGRQTALKFFSHKEQGYMVSKFLIENI